MTARKSGPGRRFWGTVIVWAIISISVTICFIWPIARYFGVG